MSKPVDGTAEFYFADGSSLKLPVVAGRVVGFFAGLTAEQQKAALAYRGDENHGDTTYQRLNFGPELS